MIDGWITVECSRILRSKYPCLYVAPRSGTQVGSFYMKQHKGFLVAMRLWVTPVPIPNTMVKT